MRGQRQQSWRPKIFIEVFLPLLLMVFWVLEILGTALIASRMTISSPVEIPPRMPPLLLERNFILPFFF